MKPEDYTMKRAGARRLVVSRRRTTRRNQGHLRMSHATI